ncbi:hypothetical protein [Actinokineospora sp. NPDC004072]
MSRAEAIAALKELATSPNYRDRADAGRALSIFADLPAAIIPDRRCLFATG